MPIQEVCVVYVTRRGDEGTEVLLGRKLTGLGAGKVVAPGGKVEPGEAVLDAVHRELREEVGGDLEVADLVEVGINRYRFPSKPSWDQNSHVFIAAWMRGEARPSSELAPFWIPVERLPWEEMWSDARLWLSRVLAGGRCDEEYVFASDLASLVP